MPASGNIKDLSKALYAHPDLYAKILDFNHDGHFSYAQDMEGRPGKQVVLPVDGVLYLLPKSEFSLGSFKYVLCHQQADACQNMQHPFFREIVGAPDLVRSPPSMTPLTPERIGRMGAKEFDELLEQVLKWGDVDPFITRSVVIELLDAFLAKPGAEQKKWLKDFLLGAKSTPCIVEARQEVFSKIIAELTSEETREPFIKELAFYFTSVRDDVSALNNKLQALHNADPQWAVAIRNAIAVDAMTLWRKLNPSEKHGKVSHAKLREILVENIEPYAVSVAIKHVNMFLPFDQRKPPTNTAYFVQVDAAGFVVVHDSFISQTLRDNIKTLMYKNRIGDFLDVATVQLYLTLIEPNPEYHSFLEQLPSKALGPSVREAEKHWANLQQLELKFFLSSYRQDAHDPSRRTLRIDTTTLRQISEELDVLSPVDDAQVQQHKTYLSNIILLEGLIRVFSAWRSTDPQKTRGEAVADIQSSMLDHLRMVMRDDEKPFQDSAGMIKRFEFGPLLSAASEWGSIVDPEFWKSINEVGKAQELNTRFTILENGQKAILEALEKLRADVTETSTKIDGTWSYTKSVEEILTRKLAQAIFKRLLATKGESGEKVGNFVNEMQAQMDGVGAQFLGNMASLFDSVHNAEEFPKSVRDIAGRASAAIGDKKKAFSAVLVIILQLSHELEQAAEEGDRSRSPIPLPKNIKDLRETIHILLGVAQSLQTLQKEIGQLVKDCSEYVVTIGRFASSVEGSNGNIIALYSDWNRLVTRMTPVEEEIKKRLSSIAQNFERLGTDIGKYDRELGGALTTMAGIVKAMETDVIDKISIKRVDEEIKKVSNAVSGIIDRFGDPQVEALISLKNGKSEINAAFSYPFVRKGYFDLGAKVALGLDQPRLALGFEGVLKAPKDDMATQFQFRAGGRYSIPLDQGLEQTFKEGKDQFYGTLGARFFAGPIPIFLGGGYLIENLIGTSISGGSLGHSLFLLTGVEL